MNGSAPPSCWRFPWRWLVDSPLVLATWVAVLLGARAIHDVDGALGDASSVRERIGFCMAKVAAEAAAMHVPSDADATKVHREMVGKVAVTVQTVGDELVLTSVLPGGRAWQFGCSRLPGAAPAVLGVASSSAVPPALDHDRLAGAYSAAEVPAFRRDAGIALLHLEAGTERDDFVLDGQRTAHGLGVATDLIVVSGHLWIEPGSTPLRLRLAHDLTVVVRGNLYVGRTFLIDGPGRVVFVTMADGKARPFADRDGNGRWSAGDVALDGPVEGVTEGSGNGYLGLPRTTTPLAFAAGLVVAGELHLATTTRVDGPLVLGHTVTRIGGLPADLVATGTRLFRPERETVAGFCVHGPRRPGIVRSAPANRDQQTLYLAAPTR